MSKTNTGDDSYDFSGLSDIMLVGMFKDVKKYMPDDRKFINAIQEELKGRLEDALVHWQSSKTQPNTPQETTVQTETLTEPKEETK